MKENNDKRMIENKAKAAADALVKAQQDKVIAEKPK